MTYVVCKNCKNFHQNAQVVIAANDPAPPSDRGTCRAKLPQVQIVVGPGGPQLLTYQPEMHMDGGCAEGDPEKLLH